MQNIAEVWQKSNFLLIKSDCTRIRQLSIVDCRWLTMLKNLKTALFQTFSTWHRILSAFTALYWPSTAFYWPSTTKYQPVPPYTDPVPSWINHYRLILIQCHQVPTSRATYWPSTIMYQPVSPSDPVPPSTEQYRLLLNQYHHISTSTAPYWPSNTKYQPIPAFTVVAFGLQTSAQFTSCFHQSSDPFTAAKLISTVKQRLNRNSAK